MFFIYTSYLEAFAFNYKESLLISIHTHMGLSGEGGLESLI
jgi:hypothetical protein